MLAVRRGLAMVACRAQRWEAARCLHATASSMEGEEAKAEGAEGAEGAAPPDPAEVKRQRREALWFDRVHEDVHSYMDSDFGEDPVKLADIDTPAYIPHSIKKKMFFRYKTDPDNWDVAKLSQFYGISRQRTIAILTLMRIEERMVSQGFQSPRIEEAMEVALAQDMPDFARYEPSDPVKKANLPLVPIMDDVHVDEELLDSIVPPFLSRSRSNPGGSKNSTSHEVLHSPLSEEDNTTGAPRHMQRWKLAIRDVSDTSVRKLCWIRDTDGTFRPSTVVEERARSWRKKRGTVNNALRELEEARAQKA